MRLCSGLKKNCCLFVVAILLIAGICFQSFETYSYFERSSQNFTDVMSVQETWDDIHNYGIGTGMILQEKLIDYASYGTQEVSGVRISSVTRAAETCINTGIRLLLICSVLTVLSKNIQKEKRLAKDAEDAGSRVWDLIPGYIHLKDGEKA